MNITTGAFRQLGTNHRVEFGRNFTRSNYKRDWEWDSFREDSHFQAFHVILHKVFQANRISNTYRRLNEMFWYAHQQIVRRYVGIICIFSINIG